MRAHPPVGQQLLQTGSQQVPVVVVRFVALAAVDDDPADPAGLEEGLVDGQIREIGQQLGAFGVADRLVQPVFVFSANSLNVFSSIPGTWPSVFSTILVILNPSPTLSIVTSAVV